MILKISLNLKHKRTISIQRLTPAECHRYEYTDRDIVYTISSYTCENLNLTYISVRVRARRQNTAKMLMSPPPYTRNFNQCNSKNGWSLNWNVFKTNNMPSICARWCRTSRQTLYMLMRSSNRHITNRCLSLFMFITEFSLNPSSHGTECSTYIYIYISARTKILESHCAAAKRMVFICLIYRIN